eukprot:COSAG05_NODE_2283_length_3287_cov_5.276035_6_plen_31_part_00
MPYYRVQALFMAGVEEWKLGYFSWCALVEI